MIKTPQHQQARCGVLAPLESRIQSSAETLRILLIMLLVLGAAPACTQEQQQQQRAFGLPTVELTIGGHRMTAEIADTPEIMARGLMHRPEMPENQGMIFVYEQPQQVAFWMKNTLLPLSIAYIDPDGVILEIHDLQPLDETSVRSASRNVRFGLEVNQGWFRQRKIEPGARIEGLQRWQRGARR